MKSVRHTAALLVVLLISAAAAQSSAAGEDTASPWATTEHGAVRLVAGITAVGSEHVVPAGIEFRMRPGWHVYWRSPGDAGYPPQANWGRSDNLADAALRWPAPHRFTVLDLQTIGYSDGVLLPVDVKPARPGDAVRLRATVDYLTCSDICVPYTAELALDIPAGPANPSAHAHDIARAMAKVPGSGAASGLTVDQVSLDQNGAGSPTLAVAISADEPLVNPDVFAEAPPPLVFDAPQVTFAPDRRSAVLRVGIGNADGLAEPLAGQPVTVTVVDGDRAVEHAALLSANSAVPALALPSASPGIAAILALALLGGLILNLMPCVLPVLSIKLLSVVGHGGGDRRVVRSGFVATALGILFSFMVLAGAMIALRATGAAIGWGVQFQQPWFLTAMILVVTLFACNLWGLFEVPLPRAFAAAAERAGEVRGHAGHFLTGALATLLATPCSAPFLGTAIGFALSRGPGEIILVFAAVGLGLALPYLCVAAFPGLAVRLPKPGPWMRTLRRILAIALAGTAVWLAWVLAGSLGRDGALVVGGAAAAIALLLSCRRFLPELLRPVAAGAALLIALAAFAAPLHPGFGPQRGDEATAELWQPFDPARIPALVAAGNVVWVNVTADWCLTCKVNERLVLARDPVLARLSTGGVVAMRGDWTRPDEAIVHYLAGFARYGIPFDAVYGPALATGEALPELLSEDAALDALDRAGAKPVAAAR